MTRAEKLAELATELAEIKKALTIIRIGGQSYTIGSGATGTTRTVTNANYKELLADRIRIEKDIASLSNQRAVKFRAGW